MLYAVVPYAAVTLFFVVLQRRFIYQPTTAENLSVSEVGLDSDTARDVQISTPDGEVLHGWLITASGSDQNSNDQPPLVICFPGNSQNRQHRMADLLETAHHGFDVLIFDYRGFGDSSGSPSEVALTDDARLIWTFAREQLQREQNQIVILGESIGGAVALSLWSDPDGQLPRPAALLLSSTFASIPETVAWHYPALPLRYFVLDRWPSIERIPRVTSPVTIFHGTADEFVPVDQARALADARSGAVFIEIPGGTHNDIPITLLRDTLHNLHQQIQSGPDSGGAARAGE